MPTYVDKIWGIFDPSHGPASPPPLQNADTIVSFFANVQFSYGGNVSIKRSKYTIGIFKGRALWALDPLRTRSTFGLYIWSSSKYIWP